jgi:membrane-bound lytic murein transglycosylase D
LKDLYKQFGDWFLAMAAYNCGPLCVDSAIERTGYADYFQLASRRALPPETRNYVPIILALTFIGKNAQKYGLDQIAPEDPWVHDTVEISHPVDLRLVGEIVGSSVETIRDLNPSLLRMTTPNVEQYALRIPAGTRELFQRRIGMIPPEKWVWWRWHTVHYGETLTGIAKDYKTSVKAIAEVNNLEAGATLHEAAELVIPVVRPGASILSADGEEVQYRIRPGDSLGAIARRFGVTVDQLIAWNRLDGTLIRAGATLLLFGSDQDAPKAPVRQASSKSAAPKPPSTPATRTAAQIHRVRAGDSLWKIAMNYKTSVEALRRSNSNLGDTLKVGDRVVIPAKN